MNHEILIKEMPEDTIIPPNRHWDLQSELAERNNMQKNQPPINAEKI